MVRSSKWIKGTKRQQPITAVASRLLRKRLKVVWYYAPLATKRWDEDNEYVHQLRVATRRARAALHIFADLLPQRKARWLKRRLRELRTTAGKARDLDVLAERLQSIAQETKGSHLGPVIEQVLSRRRKAQKPLATAYKKVEREGFKPRSRAIRKAVRWQYKEQEPTFAEAARTKLAPLVDNFSASPRLICPTSTRCTGCALPANKFATPWSCWPERFMARFAANSTRPSQKSRRNSARSTITRPRSPCSTSGTIAPITAEVERN